MIGFAKSKRTIVGDVIEIDTRIERSTAFQKRSQANDSLKERPSSSLTGEYARKGKDEHSNLNSR
jgi:hypothetical protein